MTIDGVAFARSGGHLAAEVSLSDCERMTDLLLVGDGSPVAVTINGVRDSDGFYCLDVSVSARLGLQCQRCLGELALDVDIRRRLRLVKSETEVSDDELSDDSVDVVVGSREMSVIALVEDELLLELPMVAMHENCVPLLS